MLDGEGVRGTVPQRIHLPLRDKLVELSFRTNRVFGPCAVVVADKDGKDVRKHKKDRLSREWRGARPHTDSINERRFSVNFSRKS